MNFAFLAPLRKPKVALRFKTSRSPPCISRKLPSVWPERSSDAARQFLELALCILSKRRSRSLPRIKIYLTSTCRARQPLVACAIQGPRVLTVRHELCVLSSFA
jgi:hypothetical protein